MILHTFSLSVSEFNSGFLSLWFRVAQPLLNTHSVKPRTGVASGWKIPTELLLIQNELPSEICNQGCTLEWCRVCVHSRMQPIHHVTNKRALFCGKKQKKPKTNKEKDREGRLFEQYLECQDTSIQLSSMFPESADKHYHPLQTCLEDQRISLHQTCCFNDFGCLLLLSSRSLIMLNKMLSNIWWQPTFSLEEEG